MRDTQFAPAKLHLKTKSFPETKNYSFLKSCQEKDEDILKLKESVEYYKSLFTIGIAMAVILILIAGFCGYALAMK